MEERHWWSPVRNALLTVLRSKAMRWFIVFLVLVVLGWMLRAPLLRSIAHFLIVEDKPCHVDAVYVLGGSSDTRGTEAGLVYKAGWGMRFRFTGGSVPTPLEVEGIDRTEAQQTRLVAIRNGVPDSLAVAIDQGTSTWEEAGIILADAQAEGFDTVMIVSSRFHLRRIDGVFRKRFKQSGITVVLHGARNGPFDDDRWWRSEDGLLMVNNEYVKLVYYWVTY